MSNGDLKRTVLLVEDEPDMAGEIVEDLTGRGYAVRHAGNAVEAEAIVHSVPINVMVVDRTLPGLDGLSMLSALRQRGFAVPALVLSALSSVDDRIKGLKAGGDDYLIKPFAMDELAARIEALLRRPVDARETVLQVGTLKLDFIKRTVTRGGRVIELLPREFKLLTYLMRRPGQTLTRAMLLEGVWEYKFVPQTNLVDVHMGKLRRKIDAPGEPPMIHNVPGVGFILNASD